MNHDTVKRYLMIENSKKIIKLHGYVRINSGAIFFSAVLISKHYEASLLDGAIILNVLKSGENKVPLPSHNYMIYGIHYHVM